MAIYEARCVGKEEFYPTEEWIRDELYKLIKNNPKTILDPCAGKGGLEYFGNPEYTYTTYDIKDYGIGSEICDFLKREYTGERFDAVVVNPPYKYTVEFIEKCFLYSDDVYVIAPIKTIAMNFANCIVGWSLNYKMSQAFNIFTSVGCFALHKSASTFGKTKISKKEMLKKMFLPEAPKTWADTFIEVDHCTENKPFIVNRLFKMRVLRDEELIQDEDIYEAGDESAFIATGQNLYVKKGDKIKRRIMYFDTMEDAKKFQKLYNENDKYIREYCYQWGNSILRLKEIPLLVSEQDMKQS